MVNDVIDGIFKFLRDLYPQYRRYQGELTQDLVLPCFVVDIVSSSYRKRIGHNDQRGFENMVFSIKFYAEDHRLISEVVENVLIRMRTIELKDGPIHTRGMGVYRSDDNAVITFRVRASLNIKADPKPLMDSLDFTQRTKK